MLIWTSEKIHALAPDPATAQRGGDLATTRNWRNLEGNEKALWGECKSSGTSFYKTQIDLNGPAFKCNCPSRKFPCKHALALFLIYVNDSEAFRIVEKVPPKIAEWLDSRKANSTNQDEKSDDEAALKAAATKARNREKRLALMTSGFDDLEIWLSDLVRQGLATTEGQAYSFWQNISARMVDSKLGGIGKKLKALPLFHGSNTKWPERMLAEFSQLYLLMKGFKKLEKLPESLQAEVLSIAGLNIRKDELVSLKGIVDQWKVLGMIEGVEDKLNFRRTWIYGEESQKTALLLDFSFGDASYPTQWVTGQSFEAEIVYYPSSYPLRAIVKEQLGNLSFAGQLKGYRTLEAFFKEYAQAIAANPWVLDFPCFLEAVTPLVDKDELVLIDQKKKKIAALNKGNKGWKMLALSGGQPIAVFGEWSGELFFPLSVITEGRVIPL